jgi:hypothetical protein
MCPVVESQYVKKVLVKRREINGVEKGELFSESSDILNLYFLERFKQKKISARGKYMIEFMRKKNKKK